MEYSGNAQADAYEENLERIDSEGEAIDAIILPNIESFKDQLIILCENHNISLDTFEGKLVVSKPVGDDNTCTIEIQRDCRNNIVMEYEVF